MAEIIALILGPTIAVGITLWWQNKKEKRDAKIRLFTTLMAFRKSYPVSYEWANALNLIDVVFANSPNVVARWHKYYDNLQDPAGAVGEARGHKYLELMSEMAKELRFPIQQTDIDKFYVPQQHGTQADLNAEFQREFLRVLKNTARFETAPLSGPASSSSATLANLPSISPIPAKDERPLGVRIFDPPDSN